MKDPLPHRPVVWVAIVSGSIWIPIRRRWYVRTSLGGFHVSIVAVLDVVYVDLLWLEVDLLWLEDALRRIHGHSGRIA